MKLQTHHALVGVGSLRIQSAVLLDVGEGLVHQTTVAALVALISGAVHQVLLAQGHQFASLPEVLTLQSASGAEGPAGAALTLRETHTNTVLGPVGGLSSLDVTAVKFGLVFSGVFTASQLTG